MQENLDAGEPGGETAGIPKHFMAGVPIAGQLGRQKSLEAVESGGRGAWRQESLEAGEPAGWRAWR